MILSVVIPVFNAEPYIKEALDSVFAQQGVELEVIAVDDASTDRSLLILRDYASHESRLTVIANATNRNAGVCRNIGMSAAHGEWLHFLDADDRVVPGAYRRFLEVAVSDDLDMIRGNGLSSSGAYLHRNVSRRLRTKPVSLASDGAELLKLSMVPWLGIVRRKLVVEKNIRFNSLKCANDVSFFMMTVLAVRRMRLLCQPLVWHRPRHAGSLVSCRHLHYQCDFENYRIVDTETAGAPARLRAVLLSGVLFNICSWLKRYRTDAKDQWPEVRKYAMTFFRTLDLSPWDGNAKMQRWYYEARQIFGRAALPDEPAFPWRIALGRCRSAANRLLVACSRGFEYTRVGGDFLQTCVRKLGFSPAGESNDPSAIGKEIWRARQECDLAVRKVNDPTHSVPHRVGLFVTWLSGRRRGREDGSRLMKLSVIIPVYNAAQHLRESLDSVLNQTERNLEVICVDDASTDESAAILREYAAKDARVSIVTADANRGTFIARKRGVAAATGDAVCFVDPDDLVKPDFAEKLLTAAVKGNYDIVQCGVDLLEMRERTRAQRAISERYFNPHAPDYDGTLLKAVYVDRRIGWNLIFRLFRADVVKRAFARMPDCLAINETDALAFYYVAHEARTFHRIKDHLYVYRYGDGISTRTEYTLNEYIRTLGKFDVLKAMPFQDEEAYRLMADRMLDNSFKSAAARVKDDAERGEAWRKLEAKVGPTAFLAYLAKRFGKGPGPMIELLDAGRFVTPSAPHCIRRIAIHYFRISRGGVQRVMLQVAAVLRWLGYEVVLLLEEDPEATAFEVPVGIRVIMVPRSLGGRAAPAAERVARMASILRDEKIDLLYTHAYASPMLIWDVLVCKRVLGIPVVVHYHAAFTAPMHYRLAPQAFRLQDALLRMADRVIALGEIDATYFRMRGVVTDAVPNPIPEDCERVLSSPLPAKTGNGVLWCGRDSWEKHPEDVKAIFSLVKKRCPRAELTMLTGSTMNPYDYFSKASVFLNTSETEGFSMVSLEALAHGVPVVSYALGNLDLYRDNPAVFQVPQGDVAAAAEKIAWLLESPELDRLRVMARNSVLWLRDYDHAGVWRRILSQVSGGCIKETVEAPSEDVLRRIGEELAIGKEFQQKAVAWRNQCLRRRVWSRFLSLVRKTPAFLRENGWRYTVRHVISKIEIL